MNNLPELNEEKLKKMREIFDEKLKELCDNGSIYSLWTEDEYFNITKQIVNFKKQSTTDKPKPQKRERI